MNSDRTRKLKNEQRRVLRKIVRVGRKPGLRAEDGESETSMSSTEEDSDTSSSQSCAEEET